MKIKYLNNSSCCQVRIKRGDCNHENGIPKTKVKSAMNKVNCILVKYEYKKTYDMVLYSWIIVSWYGWSE